MGGRGRPSTPIREGFKATTTLFAAPYLPFTIALCGVGLIAALEGVSALLGAPLSGLVDDAASDIEVAADVDADLDVTPDGALNGTPLETLLAWFAFGRVPLLVLLVLFLLGFGVAGLLTQMGARAVLEGPLSAGFVSVPAVVAGGLSMRLFGRALARVIPKDETAAISREALVGRPGIVTGGIARTGLPAQVRVSDEHGTTHYLLAEPDDEGERYPSGTPVIVVSLAGSKARVMRDPLSPDLLTG